MSTEKKSPTDFVKFIYGRPVIVKLYSGLVYKGGYSLYYWFLGVLTCLDGYMNVVLEQAEEYENDEFKSRYNDCFIRGNNGTFQLYALFLVIYLAPNDNV